jgi:UTP--glucose-1-phosphate uridylyltransferase
MDRRIRKAVFPVAGFGTRFLPATKAMPKELLPIVDKPLIQYAAEEAIAAGIETLIFVTGRNKRAIEDHFDASPELEQLLLTKGKYTQADLIRNILPKHVDCIFVRQSEALGLGHAINCAKNAVGSEPFTVLLADDYYSLSDSNPTLDLVKAYQKSCVSQISVMTVFGEDISKYGVIVPGHDLGRVAGVVEKPNQEEAPSNLASVGRYVLHPEIFEILDNLKPGKGGEIQLADAIDILAKKNRVRSVELLARRFDCGAVDGYIKAINYEFSKRKKL